MAELICIHDADCPALRGGTCCCSHSARPANDVPGNGPPVAEGDTSVPLRIERVVGPNPDVEGDHLLFMFNRRPTLEERAEMERLPPSPQIARDAQHFAERVILAELAVRLFRFLVLGNIIIAESPAAMEWLKDWIDGTLEGHGPLGGPMLWPDRLPTVAGVLRQWGFQPTPSVPPYVTRQPQSHQPVVPS
jgi:hypothetical protein